MICVYTYVCILASHVIRAVVLDLSVGVPPTRFRMDHILFVGCAGLAGSKPNKLKHKSPSPRRPKNSATQKPHNLT